MSSRRYVFTLHRRDGRRERAIASYPDDAEAMIRLRHIAASRPDLVRVECEEMRRWRPRRDVGHTFALNGR